MTIGQILAEVEANRTEAEILLSHILKEDRSFLSAYPERQLTETQLINYQSLIKRRLNGEPIAYILGYKDFFGHRFLVNKNVLIPRPLTVLSAGFPQGKIYS